MTEPLKERHRQGHTGWEGWSWDVNPQDHRSAGRGDTWRRGSGEQDVGMAGMGGDGGGREEEKPVQRGCCGQFELCWVWGAWENHQGVISAHRAGERSAA